MGRLLTLLRRRGGEAAGLITDFSGYPLGAAPGDWTARWVTSNVTYTIRDASVQHDTNFAEYTASETPSDWTARWVTTNVTYTVEEP